MNTAFKNFYARASNTRLRTKSLPARRSWLSQAAAGGRTAMATSANAETRYVLGTAQMGTIVASVNGSGQVAASSEVDVSGASSGKLIAVNVKAGQEVKAGALLAQVDPTDALYDVQTAQLSYDKLVTVDPEDLQSAKDDVVDAYADAPRLAHESVERHAHGAGRLGGAHERLPKSFK